MNQLLLFVFLLFSLFIISKILIKHLSLFFLKIVISKKILILLISIILLPGTIIHELSHLVLALILFVPVYKISFFPKIDKYGFILGNVSIKKSDSIRRFLIAISPIFIGTILIILLSHLIINLGILNLYTLLIFYLIFSISNTMFSSKKDLEGLVIFISFIVVFIAIIIFLLLNNYLSLRYDYLNNINNFFEKINIILLIPIVINLLILFFVRYILKAK